jgi:hypothetical protein
VRLRVGLAVGAGGVHAVGVRRGRILWALEGTLEPGEPIERGIAQLLARAPLPRWPRATVVAAVGPSRSQTKRLHGLPPVDDPRLLSRVVAEGAGRFFLKNGIPLSTGGVRVNAAGEAWGAAYDQPVVSAIEGACRTMRLDLRAIVPAVAVLGRAFDAERVTWVDGDAAAELTIRDGILQTLRRVQLAEGGPHGTVGTPVTALATLGENASRFAAAYGAALLERVEPLAVRQVRRSFAGDAVPSWRVAAVIAALALSATAALVAPGIAAMRASHVAEARLAQLAPRRAAAVGVEIEVARVSAALAEVSAFDAKRRSRTLFVAGLSDALGEESAVVALRIDSAGGSIVVIAPRAAPVLARLERVAGVGATEIVGPVTKELVASRELERVTIRFRNVGEPR